MVATVNRPTRRRLLDIGGLVGRTVVADPGNTTLVAPTESPTVPAFPTYEMRVDFARIIDEDTERELQHLGLPADVIARRERCSPDDPNINLVLATLTITEPGMRIHVSGQMLRAALMHVHTDVPRALESLDEDPNQFNLAHMYCGPSHHHSTIQEIAAAAGCRVTFAR